MLQPFIKYLYTTTYNKPIKTCVNEKLFAIKSNTTNLIKTSGFFRKFFFRTLITYINGVYVIFDAAPDKNKFYKYNFIITTPAVMHSCFYFKQFFKI